MKKTIIVSILVIGCLLSTSMVSVNAFFFEEDEDVEMQVDLGPPIIYADIYVDDNADPEWYDETHVKTIQEGINVAEDGDLIYVFSGTYTENVLIDKSITLRGQDKDTTFIDYGVDIKDVDEVEVSRFTITDNDDEGILILRSSNTIVTGNVITGINSGGYSFVYGIFVGQSNNNNIIGNTITNIKGDFFVYGISATVQSNLKVNDNTIKNLNGGLDACGIEIIYSSNSNIINNSITKINGYLYSHGILSFCCSGSTNNVIKGNIIDGAHNGIGIFESYNFIIDGNKVSGGHVGDDPVWNGHGIWLIWSVNNLITHNNFIENAKGAGFRHVYFLGENEEYVWGEIPEGFNESNTWDQNYWPKPLSKPKKIEGTLLVFLYGGSDHYEVTLFEEDPNPLTKSYYGSYSSPSNYQSIQQSISHQRSQGTPTGQQYLSQNMPLSNPLVLGYQGNNQ